MLHPVLTSLELRAGASDQDVAAWLAERATGVTATEVRDLYLGGEAVKLRLINQKLGRVDAFSGQNKYTAWGKKREPVIASWVQQRFGIAPESRVIKASDHPQKLASPDGVGIDFADHLVVSEIKTSKDDIAPGTEHFEKKGYLAQMVWVMRVTGARRCLYVWEQHDSDWQDRGGQFEEPAPLNPEPTYQWFDYDEKLAATLEAIAIDFLDALEQARADGPDVLDEVLDTHAVNVLRFREDEVSAKKAKEQAWAALLAALDGGEAFSQRSDLAQITYTPGGEETASEVPDVQAAKDADPALFAEVEALSKRWNEHQAKFKKPATSVSKPHLTVTSVKAAKGTKR
jgi:hypothetical protein